MARNKYSRLIGKWAHEYITTGKFFNIAKSKATVTGDSEFYEVKRRPIKGGFLVMAKEVNMSHPPGEKREIITFCEAADGTQTSFDTFYTMPSALKYFDKAAGLIARSRSAQKRK